MNIKRLRTAFFLGVVCCFALPVLAQNRTITGVVTDTARHSLEALKFL